jgi:hypothetical protein
MPLVAKLGFFVFALAVKAGIGISVGGMSVVLELLSLEVNVAVRLTLVPPVPIRAILKSIV